MIFLLDCFSVVIFQLSQESCLNFLLFFVILLMLFIKHLLFTWVNHQKPISVVKATQEQICC